MVNTNLIHGSGKTVRYGVGRAGMYTEETSFYISTAKRGSILTRWELANKRN